eukprot:m.99279 g.99279  ORF g.99279 m.99279 type:complete len:335 (+) comp14899_c0_seq3:131-1135(+)
MALLLRSQCGRMQSLSTWTIVQRIPAVSRRNTLSACPSRLHSSFLLTHLQPQRIRRQSLLSDLQVIVSYSCRAGSPLPFSPANIVDCQRQYGRYAPRQRDEEASYRPEHYPGETRYGRGPPLGTSPEEYRHRFEQEQNAQQSSSGRFRRFIWSFIKYTLFGTLISTLTLLLAMPDTRADPVSMEVMEDMDLEDFEVKWEALQQAIRKFTDAPITRTYMGEVRHILLAPMYAFPGTFVPAHERRDMPVYEFPAPTRTADADLNQWYPSVMIFGMRHSFVLHFHFSRVSGTRQLVLVGMRVMRLDAELKHEQTADAPHGLDFLPMFHIPGSVFSDD